ncbi:MAG TPA: fasciclin domain-containing protein [Nocardioidaceae bacterium]|nr:fasciclin domain-containing protein [Nocardioidaceae bacterium]
MRSIRSVAIAVAAVSALTMTAACGADDAESASADSTTASQSESPMDSGDDAGAADPAANLVGPGCAGYAEAVPDGAGSVAGMAQDPVAVAAGNNPLLKTLTAAVSGKVNPKVDLVDTLNGGEFTVFAPVDDAFAKIPADTLKSLSKPANADALQSILTYHVVEGQMSPDEIAGETLTTVQGEELKISGSGDELKAQDANVICGGVQTANATVYLIDAVMMPPTMM